MRPWCQPRMVWETRGGLEKPMRASVRERLRIVVDAGEHQAAEPRGQRLLLREELAVAGVTVFSVRLIAASKLRSRS